MAEERHKQAGNRSLTGSGSAGRGCSACTEGQVRPLGRGRWRKSRRRGRPGCGLPRRRHGSLPQIRARSWRLRRTLRHPPGTWHGTTSACSGLFQARFIKRVKMLDMLDVYVVWVSHEKKFDIHLAWRRHGHCLKSCELCHVGWPPENLHKHMATPLPRPFTKVVYSRRYLACWTRFICACNACLQKHCRRHL